MDNVQEGELLTPLPRKQGESITMNFVDAMRELADKEIIKIASVRPSILSDFSSEAKSALEVVEKEIIEIIEEAK